ncbi:MAG: LPS export ABC transporter periplasmic protein LptC [Candidatus Omnitrophota bacterium]
MISKSLIWISAFFLSCGAPLYALDSGALESAQQINEFSLAGYGEKGKKTWDLSAHSADIFDNIVKLKEITGNLYGEQEDIALSARKGDFDKVNSRVHLEEKVVITSSGGARLTTDSLDWDRKEHIVSTDELVSIEKGNMVTSGRGARGNTDLRRVDLKKDAKVEITQDKTDAVAKNSGGEKMTITCDGALQIDYEKNVAVFNKNVKVVRQDLEIDSDTMEVYFIPSSKVAKGGSSVPQEKASGDMTAAAMGNSIDRIVARGNVRIMRGENVSYSDEAMYKSLDKKITLLGSPRLIIYSAEEFNAPAGN